MSVSGGGNCCVVHRWRKQPILATHKERGCRSLIPTTRELNGCQLLPRHLLGRQKAAAAAKGQGARREGDPNERPKKTRPYRGEKATHDTLAGPNQAQARRHRLTWDLDTQREREHRESNRSSASTPTSRIGGSKETINSGYLVECWLRAPGQALNS